MPLAQAEERVHPSVPSLPTIETDRLKTAKALVKEAVKLRKVFSVHGPYPVIRAALWARGWVERLLPLPARRGPHCHGDEVEDEGLDDGWKEENLPCMYNLMSRLVRNETTHFYWTTRQDDIDCRSLRHDQITNHYTKAGTFTTKVGLCVNLRNLQWFDKADPDTFFPRCYRLGVEEERQAFIEDFRKTACTSLLQHVVETSRWTRNGTNGKEQKAKNSTSDVMADAGRGSVGPGIIDMALRVCQQYLSTSEHGDIDVAVEESPSVEEQQWAEFLQGYYIIVHEGATIRGNSLSVERCKAMLLRMQEVCPQLYTDGLNNIWIIKPGAKSRGRGIVCLDRLDEILAMVDHDRALAKESKWVVQKYLERPLLVHGTKFDLRQWFLVTDWNPLTIWFYRECYLRFSNKPYTTKNLDSSIHLCNNSIQKHFQPDSDRHPAVPKDNMWSCTQFQAFLQKQGHGAEWESVVVPGMQQAVVHALQTAQDLVEARKASFELYGADFMLGRDLRPWLLEINASPTLARSTAVTARLCPAVQLDILRIVLDRRTDPHAYTGGFQLIYKQDTVDVPLYMGVSLLVEGASLRQSRSPKRRYVSNNQNITIHSPSDQSTTEEVHTRHKPPGQTSSAVCALRSSSKEKKRQLTSISPRSECEGRREVQNRSHFCKSSRCRPASEHPLPVQTKPKRKAQCLGLGANAATLLPWSLSLSLSPQYSMSGYTGKPRPGYLSQISGPYNPPTALENRHRTSTNRIFQSLQGPLPTLEVFSLRRNIVGETAAVPNPNMSSHSCIHRHMLHLCSRRQRTVRDKGKSPEEHKH